MFVRACSAFVLVREHTRQDVVDCVRNNVVFVGLQPKDGLLVGRREARLQNGSVSLEYRLICANQRIRIAGESSNQSGRNRSPSQIRFNVEGGRHGAAIAAGTLGLASPRKNEKWTKPEQE